MLFAALIVAQAQPVPQPQKPPPLRFIPLPQSLDAYKQRVEQARAKKREMIRTQPLPTDRR